MSSIMKGIVDESEEVAVIYIDGKPSTKYAKKHEAEADAARMREKFPNKKIEIKHEVRETEAKKGADGKRCWKGKRYAGTENGKDKCIPVKEEAESKWEVAIEYGPTANHTAKIKVSAPDEDTAQSKALALFKKKFPDRRGMVGGCSQIKEAANPAQQAAIAINMKKQGKKPKNEGVIIGHDANDPDVAVLGGAGSYKLSNLKKKAQMEASQLAKDISEGKFKNSAYNVKQLANTLNTIVAAEDEMEKNYFGEDYTGEFAAEKTPAINPYGGLKDKQHRGDIDEARAPHPLLKAVNKNLVDLASGEVRRREEQRRAAEKGQKAASKYLKGLDKKPSTDEVWRKIEDAVANSFPDGDPYDMLWPWLERNGLDNDDVVRAARKQGYKDLWDYWHILSRDIGHEVMNEMPDTSGPVGTQPGGWRRTDMEEDTAYAGGMGQGGNAGESYRKFKPKSAGTFKESAILKGIKNRLD